MCVEGGIEDICLNTAQTVKGLPEDACGELAVYQNLRGSTERLVHKDLTYITALLIPYELVSSLRSSISPASSLKS